MSWFLKSGRSFTWQGYGKSKTKAGEKNTAHSKTTRLESEVAGQGTVGEQGTGRSKEHEEDP